MNTQGPVKILSAKEYLRLLSEIYTVQQMIPSLIADSGLPRKHFAYILGITEGQLYRRLKLAKFTALEITAIMNHIAKHAETIALNKYIKNRYLQPVKI